MDLGFFGVAVDDCGAAVGRHVQTIVKCNDDGGGGDCERYVMLCVIWFGWLENWGYRRVSRLKKRNSSAVGFGI